LTLRFLKYQTKLTKYWIVVFNSDSQRNIALVDIAKKQQRLKESLKKWRRL
jgi:hypothetical protein